MNEIISKLLTTLECCRNQHPQLEQLEQQIFSLALKSTSGNHPLYQCLRELMALLRIAKETSPAGKLLYLCVLGDIAFWEGKPVRKHAGPCYLK